MAWYEYKPVPRMEQRDQGDNSGDLWYPLLMIIWVIGCLGVFFMLMVGLAKLIA